MQEMSNRNYKKFVREGLQSFVKDIDKLRYLVRFQNCPRLINETVAEHSWYTAIIVLKFREYFEFNLETALKTALIHDCPEAYISDVPHNIKERNPELASALDKAEHQVMLDMFSDEAADLILDFNEGKTPEGLICQLADIISVIIYSNDELKAGNTKFNYVAIKAIKRVEEVLDKLEPYINPIFTKKDIENKIKLIVNIY